MSARMSFGQQLSTCNINRNLHKKLNLGFPEMWAHILWNTSRLLSDLFRLRAMAMSDTKCVAILLGIPELLTKKPLFPQTPDFFGGSKQEEKFLHIFQWTMIHQIILGCVSWHLCFQNIMRLISQNYYQESRTTLLQYDHFSVAPVPCLPNFSILSNSLLFCTFLQKIRLLYLI